MTATEAQELTKNACDALQTQSMPYLGAIYELVRKRAENRKYDLSIDKADADLFAILVNSKEHPYVSDIGSCVAQMLRDNDFYVFISHDIFTITWFPG